MMQLPLAFLDASVIEEVSIELWRQVFDEVGWPQTLQSKQGALTHADILGAFEREAPTDDLLQAIDAMHTLGNESGREAIAAAMNDCRIPSDSLESSDGERALAVRLFLAQRHNAALADVFVRAQAQAEEGADHRRYNEFLGNAARSVMKLKAKGDALREEVLRYCVENDLGDHVHVRTFEDDGVFIFHVIRSHHTKTPLAVLDGASSRATLKFRPVHGDVLRYDAFVGRLRVAARASSMVEFYRRSLGSVLFDDELFFAGEPVCSLDVLQISGPQVLASHREPGIGRVWMTECLWERSDRDVVSVRSNDCFRALAEMGVSLAVGKLVQAKLKLEVAGRSTRPLAINIRVPGRIEISQKRHEQLADRFLEAIGIRNARARAPESDLWALDPWRQSVTVWRSLFRSNTDALIAEGILVPTQLDSVPSNENPAGGRVLKAERISDTEFYGVSQASEIPSRSLSSTDLDGFELKPDRFRAFLRSRLGLVGQSTSWDGSEILDLGLLEAGDCRLRVFYAIRGLQSGIGDRLRSLAAGNSFVVLVPSANKQNTELPCVLLDDPLPSRKRVTRDAVVVSKLDDRLPAVFFAPEGVRLVVDTRYGKIWVDGVEIVGLRADTHPFRFVSMLAKSTPRSVATSELTNELSSARKDGDTTARQAKNSAKKAIIEAMASARLMLDGDPFPSAETGHYRCVLSSYVI